MIKDVLIIFKTHLDIGFTNYSSEVIKNYLENYIPNAIKVGYELKDTDTPFVWTVGSWLIWEALKNDIDHRVENAIKDGIIRWHSLPFTSHSELMTRELLDITSDYPVEKFGLTGFEKIEADDFEAKISWQLFDNSDYELCFI